jgi:hypothetical protein|tara:strand:- start:140 stop:796 length:657 start_codon:yes stop_codon:yes gene_type:complete
MNFKKKKYQLIKKVISKDMAHFIYGYFLMKRRVTKKFLEDRYISPFEEGWGTWTDAQVPNTYSHYGDLVMEALLQKVKPKMEKETKLKLVPTYSYARIYKKGDKLRRHKDRFSCEVSTTLHLGGDPWSIFLDPTGGDFVIDEQKEIHKPNAPKGIKVDLKPGDMLIYLGCELEHWREVFQGQNCAQVFLHYNQIHSPGAIENRFDRRPFLGLPAWFKK